MCVLQTGTYAKGGPMEMKFGGIEMQKWNIPNDRAQREGEKISSFVWLSCLLPKLRP